MLIKKDSPMLKNITKERLAVSKVRKTLENYPLVLLYGPRRVGKSTALAQLALNDPKTQYFDCRFEDQVIDLRHFIDNDDDVLLLVDEAHRLAPNYDWLLEIAVKAHGVSTFKAVIAGSVTAYMSTLASELLGGGRSKRVRMPIITYLEYLYFTDAISSYDVDLRSIDYGNSFIDYMTLKNLEHMNISIDDDFIAQSVNESKIAYGNFKSAKSLLNDKPDDYLRAILLLTYDLIDKSDLESTYREPLIGNREFQQKISMHLIKHGIIDNYSVYKAASSKMTNLQIAIAVRYLLWSELALYCQEVNDIEAPDNPRLLDLYLGKEESFASNYLENLFIHGSIQAVNPLVYSAISNELWEVLQSYMSDNEETDANMHVFNIIKNKLKNRTSFMEDKSIIGYWVECYIRGAFTLMASDTPMLSLVFQDATTGKEVDVVSSYHSVMIECSVRSKDKKADEVHFDLAWRSKGKMTCILTTKRTCSVEMLNGVKVLKMPYCMLAAFLDRGQLPRYENFS
jgi:hypothetical protein